MDKRKASLSVIVLLLLGLALSSGGRGCGIIVAQPPFKTDKLSTLIVEETDDRTTARDAVFDAVESSVLAGGGQFRRLDKDQRDLSMDAPWVQEAWKVKGSSVPWIVAATPRTGVNQALPLDKDAAVKLVQPLGGK